MYKAGKSKRRSLRSIRLRPAIYCLVNTPEVFQVKAPLNSNLLTFIDTKVEQDYTKRLYIDQNKDKPSEDFCGDLIFFYSFLTLLCTCLGIFSILFYTNHRMSFPHLIFHLVFLILILLISYSLLYLVSRYKRFLSNVRLCYFLLGILIYTYLIMGQDFVLSRIFSDDPSDQSLPLDIGIISVTLMLRIILFDSYLYTLCSVVYALGLYLGVSLSLSTDRTQVLSSFCVVFLALVFQLLESQQLEYRSKQIFWLQTRDERTYKTSASMIPNAEAGISSEPELIIKACDKIQRNIKKARSVIMYRDIKDSLKVSQIELDVIKQRIGNALYSTEVRLENTLIDADDKEFITQNFIDVGYKSSEKSSSAPHTVLDFAVSAVHYPFRHYGLDQMESVLSQVGQTWNFDIWFVQESIGQSLSVLGKYLFKKWSLTQYLMQTEEKVGCFFERLEAGYLDNPYHNACHAAEVAHSQLFFLMQSSLKGCLTSADLISCIIAALGHDLGHPAVTNRFLVNNRDKIALRYNDCSVLESMHAAKTYQVMSLEGSDILSAVSGEEWGRYRKMVIGMIMETDMSRHFEILGKFRTRVNTLSNIDIETFDDKLQVLAMGIKCADIGHSAKETEMHKRWTMMVCEEFFRQGDLEKERGQSVSMYCDRENTDIAKSQMGFLKNICLPLYEAWGFYLQSDAVEKYVIAQLRVNLESWSSQKKRRETTKIVPERAEKLKRMKSTK